jgi:guanine deaminase
MPSTNKNHALFLQQAIDLACHNTTEENGGPYGAVIVKENQIIASSGNRVTPNLDPTAHAEIMAIRQACQILQDYQLNQCILYSSCEPCPMCLGAIYWARLDQVFFASTRYDAAKSGFDDNFIYEEIAKPPQQRRIPMQHISLASANRPFEEWQQLENKKLY